MQDFAPFIPELLGTLSRRKLKSSRQIALRPLRPRVWGPLKVPRSSGINGAKSCILGLSWHLISHYRFKLQKQISTEQKQAKNKRLMHLTIESKK
jgi:hypothetical protein